MSEPTILDAHAHFWDPRTTPRAATPLVRLLGWSPNLLDWVAARVFPRDAASFFASPKFFTRRYAVEEYARDTATCQVIGLVHVEAGWEGKGTMAPVGETR